MLDVGDVDLHARTVRILHGKGNRARVLKFSPWVVHPLSAWLKAVRRTAGWTVPPAARCSARACQWQR
jgi:site-specific recombinase XerC